MLSSRPLSNPFGSRRGLGLYASGRFHTSPRLRKQNHFLSFRNTRRQSPRPQRTKEMFDKLLKALNEGIQGLKIFCEEKKKEIPCQIDGSSAGTKYMTHYMELEKSIKSLERRIRTLEVHRDKVEEMKDNYELKLKLREGAFNLAQALSSQGSKASKGRLQEARAEQKDLLEDLCDLEDELDTKLGVFTVHITGIEGPNKLSNGDTYELQLKLSNQKWKARCRVEKHEQMWQDNDIIFIGRITDEINLKLVEVHRMQADTSIGTAKWRTREMLTFFPQSVTVIFSGPSGTLHLAMNIRWSPTIEDDFLSEVDLPIIDVVIGNSRKKSKQSSSSSLKHNGDSRGNLGTMESRSGSLLSVKKAVELEPGHRKWADEQSKKLRQAQQLSPSHSRSKVNGTQGNVDGSEAGFSINQPSIKKRSYPPSPLREEDHSPPPLKGVLPSVISTSSQDSGIIGGPLKTVRVRESYEAAISLSSTPSAEYPDSLVSALEAVNSSLEEAKVVYADLRALEFQLIKLEKYLRGVRIHRSESMTLSETLALDSFSFLSGEETPDSSSQPVPGSPNQLEGVVGRMSREVSEGSDTGSREHSEGSSEPSSKNSSLQRREGSNYNTGDSAFGSEGTFEDMKLDRAASTGVEAIDKTLMQHLIYCDHLLQELSQQSLGFVGPMNYKLKSNLTKLRKEAEVIKDVINMLADLYAPPHLEEVLPELASNQDIFKFWKDTAGTDNLLCVSCDTFILEVDKKFGVNIWTAYPQLAHKVFLELLNRVLDLENETGDLTDYKLVVTVFQFAAYFRSLRNGFPNHLEELAKELEFLEGTFSQDEQARITTAHKLPKAVFNKGAMVATAVLLNDKNQTVKAYCLSYLDKLLATPAWHKDAILYYSELLEHSDQVIRKGACTALGRLKAVEAAQQLKYLAKVDFPEVRESAKRALLQLGHGKTASSTKFLDEEESKPGGAQKKRMSASLLDSPTSMRSRSAPAVARSKVRHTKSASGLVKQSSKDKDLPMTHV